MTRNEAYKLLTDNVKTDTLIKHCLATEAIMRALAEKFGEDVEKWGLAGLLHDIDFDETKDAPTRHAIVGAEILQEAGVDSEIINTIKAHNAEALGLERKSNFDYALASAETITGLIVATALVQPDKKLASVKPSSVVKRMKKKDFARNVNRDIIRECENLGLNVNEFAEIGVEAMKGISEQLGL